MIRVNLLPTEDAQRAAGQRQELAVGSLVVALAVLLLVLAHGWQQLQIVNVDRKLAATNKGIEAIQGSYVEISRMEQQKAELKEKLQVISELEARSSGPVRVLADVSAATPDRLWLTDFAESNGKITLTGFGVDEQTVAEFLRRLSASPYFKSVDLDETSEDEKSGLKDKKFVISGQVNYLGAQAPAKTAEAPAPAKAKTVAAKTGAGR